MDHARAKQLFKTIQARPYSLSLKPGEPSNNCYFKGIELLQQLGVMGYTVRGRVGETYWDKKIIPAAIVDLLPPDMQVTHFYTEVLIDGAWRIVDPSFQTSLARHGFQIGAWENGKSCFPITKLYTQEEALAYQAKWFDADYQHDFFSRGLPCWTALNNWFKENA